MKLQIGDPAPAFSAPDQEGVMHTLTDYAGQWLLLYFYPQDDTPGCTTEACQFRDAFSQLQHQVIIVGVSQDSIASHQKFVAKYGLPFTLLADEGRQLIEAYGATGLLFNKRVSFLISPDGKIAKIYERVDVKKHAQELLTDLQGIQAQT